MFVICRREINKGVNFPEIQQQQQLMWSNPKDESVVYHRDKKLLKMLHEYEIFPFAVEEKENLEANEEAKEPSATPMHPEGENYSMISSSIVKLLKEIRYVQKVFEQGNPQTSKTKAKHSY